MKTAYFDCFAGISGDMIIGAFLDSGFDFQLLKHELSGLALPPFELTQNKVSRSGISAIKFTVSAVEETMHRSLNDIIKIIDKSTLHPSVKENSIAIFNRIAETEARIHNIPVEKIHFHEIGALDSIIDICGAAICFHELQFRKIVSSAVNTGEGFTNTMHGRLPVPAPATAELLKGIPIYSDGTVSELATPTGAAVISHYCMEYGKLPVMKTNKIGYGAGTKILKIPNILRLFTGETEASEFSEDEISEIETSIDDMNPEFYSHLFDLILAEGGLDVSAIPAVMKKNRPGTILKVLSPNDKADNIAGLIFRETTTSGIRVNRVKRKILQREIKTVNTEYGDIRVKIHKEGNLTLTVSPEYDDCRKAAAENSVPVKDVYNRAIIAAYALF